MRHIWSGALLCMVLFSAIGCGKKVDITCYPEFYTEDLKCIAVVPFRSATSEANAGTVVSENLSRALMQNNTYRVFSHNDLAALESQRDLMIYAKTGDAASAAAKFRPGGKVQGLLVGTVTTYAHTSNSQMRSDPIQQWDSRAQMFVTTGYRQYQYTRNEATVAVSAALIRVSDGTQIYATPEATGRAWAEGEVPTWDRYECLRRATDEAVAKLVQEFAVTRQQITFYDKDFRLATDCYDNKWNYVDRFDANQAKMYAVLSLPDICDRNKFRITVIREGQRQDLACAEFSWKRGAPRSGQGFEFSPVDIAQKGGGPGNYVAKFYSGPDVICEHPFRIDPAKK